MGVDNVIGFSADFRLNESIHTKAFRDAMSFTCDHLIPRCRVKPKIYERSDNANPDEAILCAKYFIEVGVKVVVGHFASPAALAASEIYAANDIITILPAATNPILTSLRHCYQVCPDDSKQADAIEHFIRKRKFKKICVLSDEPIQKNAILASLNKSQLTKVEVTHCDVEADMVLFIGRYRSAVKYLERSDAETPVLFSDDIKTNAILKRIDKKKREMFFLGFNYPYGSFDYARNLIHKFSPRICATQTYFLETVAATQIALNVANAVGTPDLNNYRWDTLLGDVQFKNNKNIFSQYGIWEAGNNQFNLVEVE